MISFKIILRVILLLGGATYLYFSSMIDQSIAYLPYDVMSHTFYGETSYLCQLIYFLVPCLTFTFIVFPLTVIALRYKFSTKCRKAALTTLLALAIGPGLMVNVLCKNHWGRARPYQVIRDHKVFSPVWHPHFNRPQDNSFCSGHAAIGFFCGVPLWVLRRRKLALSLSLAGASVIGVVRILQGGHYLSDVLSAGGLVWLGLAIAIYLMDNVINKYLWKSS